jgi:hypothetical protein
MAIQGLAEPCRSISGYAVSLRCEAPLPQPQRQVLARTVLRRKFDSQGDSCPYSLKNSQRIATHQVAASQD